MHSLGALLAVVGGVLIAVSSFAPWAAITTDLGKILVSGWSGDGKITLFLGIGCVIFGALGFKFRPRAMGITAVVLATLVLLVGIADIAYASSRMSAVSALLGATVALQWGIYLLVVAGIVALAGGVMLILKKQL